MSRARDAQIDQSLASLQLDKEEILAKLAEVDEKLYRILRLLTPAQRMLVKRDPIAVPPFPQCLTDLGLEEPNGAG
jgi:hypothetical protein